MERMFAKLVGSFGLLAASLAALGLYGVLAYAADGGDRYPHRPWRGMRRRAVDGIARQPAHASHRCLAGRTGGAGGGSTASRPNPLARPRTTREPRRGRGG